MRVPKKMELLVPISLLLLASVSLASQNPFQVISSSGQINMAGLIFVGFENSTDFLVGRDAPIWTSDATAWVLQAYPELHFESSTVMTYNGLFAANLTLANPSSEGKQRLEILRDINSSELTDVWLSAWYYIPSGTPVDGFITVHRPIYERLWNTSGYERFQYPVGIVNDTRVGRPTYRKPVLTVPICQGEVDNNFDGVNDLIGSQTYWDGDFEVPFGQWFRITTYVHRDMTNGIFKLWFNGQLKMDLNPVRTIGILPERINQLYHGTGGNEAYASIGFSLYTSIEASPKSVFVDNVAIMYSQQFPLTP